MTDEDLLDESQAAANQGASRMARKRRAEAIARAKAEPLPPHLQTLSPDKIEQIFHELRIHQVELEARNQELRQAQADLDAERARYFELYDLAPVGYLTLNEAGLIQHANLTASSLFGVRRTILQGRALIEFVDAQDQELFHRQLKSLRASGETQTWDARLVKAGGDRFWAQISTTSTVFQPGQRTVRLALNDITERRQAETERRTLLERYNIIFNSVTAGVVFRQADGEII
jgi:PAS domain S-box-containing protein